MGLTMEMRKGFARQNRALVGQPATPSGAVAAQIVVAGDAILGRHGVERRGAQRAQAAVHRQGAVEHAAVAAGDA